MKLRNPYQFFGKIYTISTRSFSLHTKQILEIKLKRNHFQPFFNICFVSNISYFASSGELMGCNYASNNEVVTKEVNRYPQLYSPKSLSSLVGIRSTRGMRMFNEDRYRIGKITENVHYIGLFDGFSGSLAADHVASTLHEHLYACLRNPFFRHCKIEHRLSEVVRSGVILTSKSLDIAAAVGHSADHSLPCQGTTCLVALFCGDTLCVGNVGDTRAFVAGKNGIKTLSTIHNLTNEEERLRILKAGGEVVELPNGILRVNGHLTLTRTLGCTCFRKFGVLTECDTSEYLLSKDDAFLLLATDGLWEVFTEDEVVEIIKRIDSPSEAAQQLQLECELAGGEDNCTIIIKKLSGWHDFMGKSNSEFQKPPPVKNRLA